MDITLIRRHILGIAALDSPYKILAGDVNGSGSVSTLDITLIRRVILGITNSYPGPTWRFVRSDFQFADPQVPWSHESARTYTNLTADALDQDFTGIKLGDVNGTWTAPTVSQQSVGNASRLGGARLLSSRDSAGPGSSGFEGTFTPPEGTAKPAPAGAASRPAKIKVGAGTARWGVGARGKIGIAASGLTNLTTAQFTLRWDPAVLEFARTSEYRLPGLTAENFGLNRVNEGQLTFSWDDLNAAGVTLADATDLFAVEFRARGESGRVSQVELVDGPTGREVTVGLREVAADYAPGFVTIDGRNLGVEATGLAPRLSLNSREGLKISGTVGSRYRIEFVEELPGNAEWRELRTVELKSGEQIVPLNELIGPTNRFYRAILVP